MRVFVNARPVDVPSGCTALDAVRAFDVASADAVAQGRDTITDSRGLPADPAMRLEAGAILRLVPRRQRDAAASDDDTF